MKHSRATRMGVINRAFLTLLISVPPLVAPGLSGSVMAQASKPQGVRAAAPADSPPTGLDLPPALGEELLDLRAGAGLPQIAPQPPQPVAPFIDRLKAEDAAFDVVIGRGRILSTKEDITTGRGQPLIAAGDPSVIEFTVLSARQIRVTGLRIGVTELSIATAAGRSMSFEVRVVFDLDPLAAKLKAHFPDANLRLAQLRESIIVEGQARTTTQVVRIMEMINGYLRSAQIGPTRLGTRPSDLAMAGIAGGPSTVPNPPVPLPPVPNGPAVAIPTPLPDVGAVSPELNPLPTSAAVVEVPEVINLIRLPGSQQVLLKVRVAELNRSALRNIGANFLGIDPDTGAIVGSQLATPVSAIGSIMPPSFTAAARKLTGAVSAPTTVNSTVFGIFQDGNFEFTLTALRRNSMLKILAEPNLVAMHGHQASFLAGGQFPVPVPQVSSGGATPTVTVQFKNYGVQLNFVPYIMDEDVICLSVAPAVSQIDYSVATTLVAGGSPVPGLTTRQAQTTVELREGQTLAIAGLMQLQLDGSTDRIPGLGDLPIIGPFFSNTSSERIEKELVVLVTPYLIEGMNKDQVPPGPGDEVKGPNDLEFYLLNRIEGRTGKDFRATTTWDDPLNLNRFLKLVPRYVNGPSGFSD